MKNSTLDSDTAFIVDEDLYFQVNEDSFTFDAKRHPAKAQELESYRDSGTQTTEPTNAAMAFSATTLVPNLSPADSDLGDPNRKLTRIQLCNLFERLCNKYPNDPVAQHCMTAIEVERTRNGNRKEKKREKKGEKRAE